MGFETGVGMGICPKKATTWAELTWNSRLFWRDSQYSLNLSWYIEKIGGKYILSIQFIVRTKSV